MEFISSLKTTATQIIKLTDQLGERVHTWNQEESAPAGGYTDRAGFVVFDDMQLFADVFVADDGTENLMRARLSLAPKDDDSLFTIITLDFNADRDKAKEIISKADNLNQQDLLSLLEDSDTTPKLIHVSLEAGKDSEGNSVGKRYEYTAENLQEGPSKIDQEEFLDTLNKAYDVIKIS